jgi:hypothetical protein
MAKLVITIDTQAGESTSHSIPTPIYANRLKIVRDDFSIPPQLQQPPAPPPANSQPTQEQSTSSQTSAQSTSNKENAPPPTSALSDTLPPQILTLLSSIANNLITLFKNHPPHTIQRLAELILEPRLHYQTLPSYLHALDRVVHVTSGAHVFPLPPAIPDPSSATVLSNGTLASGADPLSVSWGNPATTPQPSLGSDESLGGALLTPITWLNKNTNGTHSPLEGEVKTESTEMIEGPNGPGGVETVSVSVNGISSHREATNSPSSSTSSERTAASLRAEGGVTQGELLRQEQRAGVVPAMQLQQGHNRGDSDGMGEDDEMPHARGPEEIGMEDMGPQGGSESQRGGPGMGMQGIDVEAAVGRRLNVENDEKVKEDESMSERNATPKREAEEDLSGDEKRVKEESETKSDAMEIVDADGKAEAEAKVGDAGENKGADAVDTTTV